MIYIKFLDYNQIVIFAEGLATNGDGLIPFKRGPFDVGSPVKCVYLKYSSSNYNPNMVLISLMDSILMNCLQFKIRLEYYELEGCFYPKEFTNWEDFASNVRNLMADEFNLKVHHGTFRDKLAMENEVSPLRFEY